MPETLDLQKQRLERFIIESIRLDALLDARARDIEFVESGGQVLYSPDQSTWGAFFFPVKHGQEHKGKQGSIDGFAEVYLDSDRSDEPFIKGSPLSEKEVTGMLGKVLMDAIFAPQHADDIAPEFFLTEESKAGLNQAIKIALIVKTKQSRNAQMHERLATALQRLKKEFATAEDNAISADLFAKSPQILNNSGMLRVFLDDDNPVNLNERSRLYNKIGFFDWTYIQSQVDSGNSDEETFHFGRQELIEFDRLHTEFSQIFRKNIPQAAENKITSMSEILALNSILERIGQNLTRFVYLTNARSAIRDFDRFVWDAESEHPLKMKRESNQSRSISSLFVRSPLCFLHDIELRPEVGETQSALKTFMDSIVPKKLHDELRLDTSETKRKLVKRALKGLSISNTELYSAELENFYRRWAKKKIPWVNAFLAQRGKHLADGLEIFSKEGFHGYWRNVNREFARESWQFGFYLAKMTEEHPARAAPLVFIDCDIKTNKMLSAMQSELARGDIEKFQEQFSDFIERPAERQNNERKEYFDSLVNAVLFMFSNQFETSRLHSETACDRAMKSQDTDVTGREAYFLRSHLVRVTARNEADLEDARKLMLIARGKLEIDNNDLCSGEKISTIRFDVEDWSRRIVVALAEFYHAKAAVVFPRSLMRDYLSFVRNCTNTNFCNLGSIEREALIEQICGRMKFNFLVLAITMDSSHVMDQDGRKTFLKDIVSEWNRVFGDAHSELTIRVDEREIESASTIEESYLLALAMGVPEVDFVSSDLDVGVWFDGFFGERNRESIKSAKSSFIDDKRYRRLKKYCEAHLNNRRGSR